jgi:hypothetical protein
MSSTGVVERDITIRQSKEKKEKKRLNVVKACHVRVR